MGHALCSKPENENENENEVEISRVDRGSRHLIVSVVAQQDKCT
jgi:hypothetical protein